MKQLKDKKFLIGIVILVIVLLIGGGSYMILGKKSQTQTTVQDQQDQTIGTLTKEDLGLVFTASPDGKKVKFEITKPDDITYVEYTVSYTRDEKGETVSEGLYGDITVKPGEKVGTDYRDLGTCSSGVCRYHIVTSPLKLVLKITKKDGKQYQAEDTLSLK